MPKAKSRRLRPVRALAFQSISPRHVGQIIGLGGQFSADRDVAAAFDKDPNAAAHELAVHHMKPAQGQAIARSE